MNTMTIDANFVKKDLYKSKAVAKMSHYAEGELFYDVELSTGTYRFPISTIEDKIEYFPSTDGGDELEFDHIGLSSDLGTTPFYTEMKGSDLNRWIAKAIKADKFMKISE
jgi:hypothetical protein